MRVVVTATNAGGSSAPSAARAVVAPAAPAPVNTAPPAISGTASGADPDGDHGHVVGPADPYAYQWRRCDSGPNYEQGRRAGRPQRTCPDTHRHLSRRRLVLGQRRRGRHERPPVRLAAATGSVSSPQREPQRRRHGELRAGCGSSACRRPPSAATSRRRATAACSCASSPRARSRCASPPAPRSRRRPSRSPWTGFTTTSSPRKRGRSPPLHRRRRPDRHGHERDADGDHESARDWAERERDEPEPRRELRRLRGLQRRARRGQVQRHFSIGTTPGCTASPGPPPRPTSSVRPTSARPSGSLSPPRTAAAPAPRPRRRPRRSVPRRRPRPANTSPPTISGTRSQADAHGGPRRLERHAADHLRLPMAALRLDGAGCVAIAGATASTYAIVAVDVGSTLRVAVTASNSAGESSATSTPGVASPAIGRLPRPVVHRGRDTAPTGSKPESKLWWNDGFWWASLWTPRATLPHLPARCVDTQTWIDTGVRSTTGRGRAPTRCGTAPAPLRRLARLLDVRARPHPGHPGAPLPLQLQRGHEDVHASTPASRSRSTTPRPRRSSIDKDSTGHAMGDLDAGHEGLRQPHDGRQRLRIWGTPFVLPVSGATKLEQRRHLVGGRVRRQQDRRDVEQPADLGDVLRRPRRRRRPTRPGAQPDGGPGPELRRRPHQPQVASGRRQRPRLRGGQDVARRPAQREPERP